MQLNIYGRKEYSVADTIARKQKFFNARFAPACDVNLILHATLRESSAWIYSLTYRHYVIPVLMITLSSRPKKTVLSTYK